MPGDSLSFGPAWQPVKGQSVLSEGWRLVVTVKLKISTMIQKGNIMSRIVTF